MNAILPEGTALTCTIPVLTSRTGISRSETYRLLRIGNLRAVKSGRTTLIVWQSVLDHMASLPTAAFRSPAKRAA